MKMEIQFKSHVIHVVHRVTMTAVLLTGDQNALQLQFRMEPNEIVQYLLITDALRSVPIIRPCDKKNTFLSKKLYYKYDIYMIKYPASAKSFGLFYRLVKCFSCYLFHS